MSDTVIVALIVAATTIISALIALASTIIIRRLDHLGIQVDGRLTQLLESTRAEGVANADLARSEGSIQGGKDERERTT